jgi:hypothetical protein
MTIVSAGVARTAPSRWGARGLTVCLALLVLTGGRAGASGPLLDGATSLIGVRSADLRVTGVLSVALRGHYYESTSLAGAVGCEPGRYLSLRFAASYGVSPWLEAGFELPFRRASWRCDEGGDLTVEAVDNPSLLVKVGVPAALGPVRLAALARIGIPIDDVTVEPRGGSGGTIFLTGGKHPDHEVALLASADFTDRFPLRLHANVGWAFHGEDVRGRWFYPGLYLPAGGGSWSDNDALLLRGAVEFPGRWVDLFTEFRGDMIRDRALVAPKENALVVAPGVTVRFADGWSATLGFGVGVSGNDRSTPFDPHDAFPDWEASVAVAYAWPVLAADSDGDGIPDYEDACPRLAEDFDGYQDSDGCPDPDNDGDGIPDVIDGAPDLPEDFDGFEDEDGIPDLDNDSDGIVDTRDMCPNEAEDLDGFEDEDGCPDM